MSMSNSEARKRAAEKAVEALKAEAWDEGWAAQGEMSFDADGKPMMHVPNPYRSEAGR